MSSRNRRSGGDRGRARGRTREDQSGHLTQKGFDRESSRVRNTTRGEHTFAVMSRGQGSRARQGIPEQTRQGHVDEVQANAATTTNQTSATIGSASKDPSATTSKPSAEEAGPKQIGQIPGLRNKFQVLNPTFIEEVESLIQDHIEQLVARVPPNEQKEIEVASKSRVEMAEMSLDGLLEQEACLRAACQQAKSNA